LLAELKIRDFAIVRDLTLDFTPGLNILTGETGAGKSILVDALGLLLGDRAHADQIRSGAEESELEAVFQPLSEGFERLLDDRGLSSGEKGLFIRRRISRSGRHRAWINGSAVPVSVLAEIGAGLVDIHGQHQHQSLLRIAHHLDVLDSSGQLEPFRQEFSELYRRSKELQGKMDRITRDRGERDSRIDFLEFQKKEIEAAALEPGEEEELLQAREVMQNAGKISALIRDCVELLYEGDSAAAGQVESAALKVQELTEHLPELKSLSSALQESGAMLKESVDTLDDWLRKTEYDPDQHSHVEERLSIIGRLKRKYGATVEEVLDRLEGFREELDGLKNADDSLEEMGRQRAEILAEMALSGTRLSAGRREAAEKLEREVVAHLRELGMEKASFSVSLRPLEDPGGSLETGQGTFEPWEGGLEEVEFLISANPGEEEKSLARVASGGELSRIMLALKTSLADVDRVPTLIFDEVDTGIGGAHARIVGRKLKDLSGERQVICVTHLPQIAGLADTHYLVSKTAEEGRTRVSVGRLSDGERVGEIARMIAGETITPSAREHALELMKE
jgi:DNA repair protein RecN (Recombination protein N)